jgi:hypothetical protein
LAPAEASLPESGLDPTLDRLSERVVAAITEARSLMKEADDVSAQTRSIVADARQTVAEVRERFQRDGRFVAPWRGSSEQSLVLGGSADASAPVPLAEAAGRLP